MTLSIPVKLFPKTTDGRLVSKLVKANSREDNGALLTSIIAVLNSYAVLSSPPVQKNFLIMDTSKPVADEEPSSVCIKMLVRFPDVVNLLFWISMFDKTQCTIAGLESNNGEPVECNEPKCNKASNFQHADVSRFVADSSIFRSLFCCEVFSVEEIAGDFICPFH